MKRSSSIKRSSSKLIGRVGSVRNIGKVPLKFRFELCIESIDKLTFDGPVVAVWERGKNCESTSAVPVDRKTRKAVFHDQSISSNITLLKSKEPNSKFSDKVIKIAVRGNDQHGKSLGKIHLNLAEYAELSSSSKKIRAELSNGSTLLAFLKIEYMDSEKGSSHSSKDPSRKYGSSRDTDIFDAAESGVAEFNILDDSPKNLLRNKFKMKHAMSKKSRDLQNNAEIDELKKENLLLRQKIKESEAESLKRSKYWEEHEELKRELEELRAAKAREPVFDEVVTELKKVKEAIIHINQEWEKLEIQETTSLHSSPFWLPYHNRGPGNRPAGTEMRNYS